VFFRPLVLTFHHLKGPDGEQSVPNSKYYFPNDSLEKMLRESQRQGRLLISLSELIKRLKDHASTLYFEKVLAVTFDDGYVSIFEPLRNLAAKGNYAFTVFIPTSLVANTNRWDQLNGLEKQKIMNWSELEDLRTKGIEIGSHGRTHINLQKSETATRKIEIIGSREDIRQNLLGHDIEDFVFSYPYGAYDQEVIQIVKKAGYIGAVSNFKGNIRPKTDPWQIPRFTVYSNMDWKTVSRQARSLWAKELIKDIRDFLFKPDLETSTMCNYGIDLPQRDQLR
jgi:peptidoglycan/xylan/chitin deacetylase (PgdA/CDA1 family)